jgi:hypothetical protein
MKHRDRAVTWNDSACADHIGTGMIVTLSDM